MAWVRHSFPRYSVFSSYITADSVSMHDLALIQQKSDKKQKSKFQTFLIITCGQNSLWVLTSSGGTGKYFYGQAFSRLYEKPLDI